ncbi:hypothetical protein BDK51DRAFT_42658 [Blyttiomyces helicus]|uniref:DNA/RNA-binding protein Alba-like domain-containing protein n=1 Tax=Blyttiomyces helicus TaxID=388810 RepID=A0A4P9W313_9FUNG|nr:hypothetical protein BDK51DRAFT_42658 [Blyttiomyces helicus]|eukprot:RKO86564.1 hypothetical protein BDK51DRAFT_42658 [Blyttiomyces helicus]
MPLGYILHAPLICNLSSVNVPARPFLRKKTSGDCGQRRGMEEGKEAGEIGMMAPGAWDPPRASRPQSLLGETYLVNCFWEESLGRQTTKKVSPAGISISNGQRLKPLGQRTFEASRASRVFDFIRFHPVDSSANPPGAHMDQVRRHGGEILHGSYRRKEVGEDPDEPALPRNEMRITTHGKIKTYVGDVMALLQDESITTVAIYGKGKTINKAVTVAEIAKRRLGPQVRQETDIFSVEATDVWEPVVADRDRWGYRS